MKLAESMKYVLKKKSQNIVTSILKEDLKKVFQDAIVVIKSFVQNKKKIPRLAEIKSTFIGTALLIKVIPQRINTAFKIFTSEFLQEIEKIPDPRQKTVFCMKVLAGLSKLTLSSAYSVGFGDRKLLGLGASKNIYSQVIVSKLIFKTVQSFIVRFITEIEKEISDPVELKTLQEFKAIVMDDSGNAIDKIFDGVIDPEDPAFKIVENFKNYIYSGELN